MMLMQPPSPLMGSPSSINSKTLSPGKVPTITSDFITYGENVESICELHNSILATEDTILHEAIFRQINMMVAQNRGLGRTIKTKLSLLKGYDYELRHDFLVIVQGYRETEGQRLLSLDSPEWEGDKDQLTRELSKIKRNLYELDQLEHFVIRLLSSFCEEEEREEEQRTPTTSSLVSTWIPWDLPAPPRMPSLVFEDTHSGSTQPDTSVDTSDHDTGSEATTQDTEYYDVYSGSAKSFRTKLSGTFKKPRGCWFWPGI